MAPYRTGPARVVLSCPRDRMTLERRLIDGLKLDHCTRCRGVWLGAAELLRLLENQVLHERVSIYAPPSPRDFPTRDPSAAVDCLVCARPMRRYEYGGSGTRIHVDSCQEHGLWLDAGELFAIVCRARDIARRRPRPTPVPEESSPKPPPDDTSKLEKAIQAFANAVYEVLF